METNVTVVRESTELREAAQALVDRATTLAGLLVGADVCPERVTRAGRKASGMATHG
jgi:hypothetical protein